LQTTKSIRNGTTYGIRTIRSEKYKYILNLHHESKFQNNVTEQKNPEWTGFWLTWQERAKTDENVKMLVDKFQIRPEVGFYDVQNDPFELNNLAMNVELKSEMNEMRTLLDKWMTEQGDKGRQTEMDAFDHQTVRKM
jgi:N-sulfoglucosamine sulfohydrolase